MWQSLHDAWWRRATHDHPTAFFDILICQALQASSMAYQAAVALRNTAYDRGWVQPVRLPCRVISVGNLAVGGTGKTACVELLARKLIADGQQVAVLSRGYGGTRHGSYYLRQKAGRVLVDGQERRGTDGLADEPQVLASHLADTPVVIGPRRALTGQWAWDTFGSDVMILDDGLQHRQVHRDLEIVLVHARMPLGGWALLPRGPMREPLTSLKRADVIVLTKVDEALGTMAALRERVQAFAPEAQVITTTHHPVGLMDGLSGQPEPLTRLDGRRVALVSSIGDPAGFEATVRRLHATIRWHRIFPDHHRYGASEWEALCARAKADRPDALVTTEKDWVRLQRVIAMRGACPVPVWILNVRMQILEGEALLDDRLARVCRR